MLGSTDTHKLTSMQQDCLEQFRLIGSMRNKLFIAGRELGARFYAAREEGKEGGFVALNYSCRHRNQGRSVDIAWFLSHFRHGQRYKQGIKKSRVTKHTDAAALKRACPEWLYPLVAQLEEEARVIRELLTELTTMERRARVIAERCGVAAELWPSTGITEDQGTEDEAHEEVIDPFGAGGTTQTNDDDSGTSSLETDDATTELAIAGEA